MGLPVNDPLKTAHPLLIAVRALRLRSHAASGAALEIAVRNMFNDVPLLLDSLRYQTAADETLSSTRRSYLLSGFAIERDDGVLVEISGRYAWMNAEKRRTVVRLDSVPEFKNRGKWTQLGLA
ncbi:MAG: hypothetical protein EXS30_05315 [Pedosphaera sp.]|nr:hypothetical protein [Pedosphaera sp.]